MLMGLGAALWVAGNVVWIRSQIIPAAVAWWLGFLVLTIVAERLELSRLLPRTKARQPTLIASVAVYVAGLIIGLWRPGAGLAIVGAAMLMMACWLAVFDLARRTIRQSGLTRFVAACLLCGYFWLAAGGALAILHAAILPTIRGAHSWARSATGAGMGYDSIIHSVLLGFVFAMIFGHAPIIFPAVLAVRMEYRPRFYAHLAVLQISVALRIVCDLGEWSTGRKWAGLLNALAIVLFVLNTLSAIRMNHVRSRPSDKRALASDLSSSR
jgi:hypothetical protein